MTRLCLLCALALFSLTAQAGPRIAASTHPLAMIAMAVATPDADVQVLMPLSAAGTAFQLSTREEEILATADVVVWAGAEAEPWLAAALSMPRDGRQVINLAKLPGLVQRDYRLDAADTKKRARNHHYWLSTQNAALLARALGARLGNPLAAEHFAAEMQRFRNRQQARFRPAAAMPLLAVDDVYGYLYDEIGIARVTALAAEPQADIPARRVAELAQRAQQEDMACLVGPPGFEQGPAAQVFAAGHGSLVTLDPLLGGIPPARDSYILTLVQLADTLYGCLVTR